MNKLAKVLGSAVTLLLLSAGIASAASISNPLFSNGQTSIDATGSATVNGTFTLTVGSGEVCEILRTQSDPSQPFVDTSVGGQLGYQEQVYTNVPFSVKVPPNTGTVYPTVQCAGIFGGGRSINGGDNVILGATTLGTVRVVANAPGFSTTSSDPNLDALIAAVAALTVKVNALNTVPPVAGNAAVCAEFNTDIAGATPGVKTQGNVVLQGFLLSKHMSIPWLTDGSGTAFGFYGTQTTGAVNTFRAVNSCN